MYHMILYITCFTYFISYIIYYYYYIFMFDLNICFTKTKARCVCILVVEFLKTDEEYVVKNRNLSHLFEKNA